MWTIIVIILVLWLLGLLFVGAARPERSVDYAPTSSHGFNPRQLHQVLAKTLDSCYTLTMTRVKIIKDYKNFHRGQILQVSSSEAHGLQELGVAIISKDMTESDYRTGSFNKRSKKSG